MVVILDKVSDPQNVGTIIRSSLFFNCNAIINTLNGGSSETGSLVAASGAFEQVPYMQATNMAQTIMKLKKFGYIIMGLMKTQQRKYLHLPKAKVIS